MDLKNGKVFTSKFVGTGPSSYEKIIYRVAVSQRLRNTDLHYIYSNKQSYLTENRVLLHYKEQCIMLFHVRIRDANTLCGQRIKLITLTGGRGDPRGRAD